MSIDNKIVKKHSFSKISSKSVWYLREKYIWYIMEAFDVSSLIKVIIWQRRVGKSYLLRQIISIILKEKQVDKNKILYLNFEDEDLAFIKDKNILKQVIDNYFLWIKWKKHIFLDEIQEVNSWEKLINSYRSKDSEYNIFISWSNSKMLSWDLSTYLAGRYIEFEIYPFSYEEYLNLNNLIRNKETLINYINFSWFAEIYNLKNKKLQISFMKQLKDTIILKDIVKRYNLKNINLIEKVFLFMINNIWNSLSLNSIRKKLLQEWIKISITTLSNYTKYLEDIYVFYWVSRFDLHWKKILEWEKKYYLNDLWFINFLFSNFETYISKKLENYIFNLLKINWYEIYIWKMRNLEIDFIATKNNNKIYIQVAYILTNESIIKREFWNLEKIKDSFQKYVVSLDDINFWINKNGIKHIRAWELSDYL